MSNHALNVAWQLSLRSNRRGRAPFLKLVLVRLADRANKDGIAFPSHKTIACETGLSLSTVKSILKELQRAGYIVELKKSRQHRSITWRLKFLDEPVDSSPRGAPDGPLNEDEQPEGRSTSSEGRSTSSRGAPDGPDPSTDPLREEPTDPRVRENQERGANAPAPLFPASTWDEAARKEMSAPKCGYAESKRRYGHIGQWPSG